LDRDCTLGALHHANEATLAVHFEWIAGLTSIWILDRSILS
jgi:hypothetical protein